MTRLDWGVSGERMFEAGVDRGVFYINHEGFAWPGLISVAESSSGGEAKPYYIDGYKYSNLASGEEFQATIEAFSSPPEFAYCDGLISLETGLFATQQPRRPFDFSYRTLMGNDQQGIEYGYKIHIVYNALAAPTARPNSTLNDAMSPGTLSWAISTLAPRINGMRPTAHFIIDSILTDPTVLANVEDVLYGTDTMPAMMPDISDLIDLFNAVYVYDGGDPSIGPTTILDGGAP